MTPGITFQNEFRTVILELVWVPLKNGYHSKHSAQLPLMVAYEPHCFIKPAWLPLVNSVFHIEIHI